MDRDELKRLCELATPGPWHNCDSDECDDPYCDGIYYSHDGVGVGVLYANGDEKQARHNAEFIAAARSAVPALLAEVERLQAERDKLRERLEAVDAGRPLGPVIGAQQILELATENKQLREALEFYAKEWRIVTADDLTYQHPTQALERDGGTKARRALEGNDQ